MHGSVDHDHDGEQVGAQTCNTCKVAPLSNKVQIIVDSVNVVLCRLMFTDCISIRPFYARIYSLLRLCMCFDLFNIVDCVFVIELFIYLHYRFTAGYRNVVILFHVLMSCITRLTE